MQLFNKRVSSKNISYFRLAFSVLMIPQIFNLVPHIHELENSCIVFHYPGLEFIADAIIEDKELIFKDENYLG